MEEKEIEEEKMKEEEMEELLQSILQSFTARARHPLLVLATRHPSTVAMGT